MKKLTISDPLANCQDKEVASGTEQERIPRAQQKVSCALDVVLTYPNPLADKKKKGKSTSSMPKHLSSRQMIVYMEEKKAAKQQEEEEKHNIGRKRGWNMKNNKRRS